MWTNFSFSTTSIRVTKLCMATDHLTLQCCEFISHEMNFFLSHREEDPRRWHQKKVSSNIDTDVAVRAERFTSFELIDVVFFALAYDSFSAFRVLEFFSLLQRCRLKYLQSSPTTANSVYIYMYKTIKSSSFFALVRAFISLPTIGSALVRSQKSIDSLSV